LHTAMLTISPTQNSSTEILNLLSEAHHQIANLLRDLPPTAAPKVAQLGLTGALKQLFDDEMGQAFDEVNWQIEPEAEQQTRNIPLLAAEVLYYACREIIRNAARYARQPNRPLQLQISLKWLKGLEISIQDNGPGLATAKTDSPGSSGQGLALHSTLVAVVGGSLVTESLPGHYTKVSLNLPSNL